MHTVKLPYARESECAGDYMCRKKKGCFFIIAVLALSFFYSGIMCGRNAEAAGAYYHDYEIKGYDIDMVVEESNVFHVKETIKVWFNESRHGIYRTLPLVNKVSRADGSSHTIRVRVRNLKCVGDEYDIDREGDSYIIKIGDEDKTIYGEHIYNIEYDYVMGKDVLKDEDEFYFNIVGSEWTTTIENVSFKVNMPKEFDEDKLGFSYGAYGSKEDLGVAYNVEDNKIIGGLDGSIVLKPGDALTMRLSLPEGYFVPENEFHVFALIGVIVGAITALLAFALWLHYGKDDPVVETVEFYPPYSLNPVNIAYAYRGYLRTKDVVSLVVYLAQKKYIIIQEGKKKNDFTLKKWREYNGNSEVEKKFLDGIFKNKDVVKKSDLEDKFYRTISDITMMVDTKAAKEKLYYASSLNKGWILVLLNVVAFVLGMYQYVSEYYMSPLAGVGLGIVFSLVGCLLFILPFSVESKIGKAAIAFVCMLFAIAGGGYAYMIGFLWIYVALAVFCLVSMFFVAYMEKRTPYGNDLLGKIRGFKNFLETAEKDHLEALVTQEPQYFYDILPYTYVLDISDTWMDKFESIAVVKPDWYTSYNPAATFNMIYFHNFMDGTMRAATASMTSSPSSGGSGGGGGFSGGGSGGGGGGSW